MRVELVPQVGVEPMLCQGRRAVPPGQMPISHPPPWLRRDELPGWRGRALSLEPGLLGPLPTRAGPQGRAEPWEPLPR